MEKIQTPEQQAAEKAAAEKQVVEKQVAADMETAERLDLAWKLNPDAKKLFKTSDGRFFAEESIAWTHVKRRKLEDKIEVYTKDSEK